MTKTKRDIENEPQLVMPFKSKVKTVHSAGDFSIAIVDSG